MIQIGRKEFGISGFALRCLAIITMVLGAVGFEKGAGYDWMEAFAWTSFAFFAFLLVEGVENSADRGLYCRRMFVFTLISEIAYKYYRSGTLKFWMHNYFSAMTTLFVGLVLLCILRYIRNKCNNIVLDMIAIAVFGYGAYILADRYHFDFGKYGMLLIIAFYVAKQVTYSKITMAAVIFYISFYLTTNILTIVSIGGIQYPVAPELYSILIIPFIGLYNHRRGPNALSLQIIQYLVFPVMIGVMIILRLFNILG